MSGLLVGAGNQMNTPFPGQLLYRVQSAADWSHLVDCCSSCANGKLTFLTWLVESWHNVVNDLPSWSTCLSVFLSVGLRDESGLGRTPLSPTSVTSGYKSDVSYDRKLFYCCRCMALCCAYRFRPISSQLGALHSTLIPPHIPCLSFPVISSVLYSVSPPVCYPFSPLFLPSSRPYPCTLSFLSFLVLFSHPTCSAMLRRLAGLVVSYAMWLHAVRCALLFWCHVFYEASHYVIYPSVAPRYCQNSLTS